MKLESCRILVTPTSYLRGAPDLRKKLEQLCGEVIFNETGKTLRSSQLVKLLPGIDGYIAGLDEVDVEAIAAADRLKVIARYGVGVDKVDLEAARERGIIVTNTPGANAVSVAELTIALILSLLRRIPQTVSATASGEWPRVNGLALRGKTVGIVGLGAVGRNVAVRLRAFECTLLAFDPYADADVAASSSVALVSLEELLRRSDVVTLHAPLTGETRSMADFHFFSSLKPGAFLVNTARGELVVESDLLRAIEAGTLAGAALDVFEEEPPHADSLLFHSPKVLVTPHTAAHTDEAMRAMADMATEDCLAVLRGERPRHPVG